MRRSLRVLTAVSFSSLLGGALAQEPSPFRFESVDSLTAMANYVRDAFPIGSPRAGLDRAFVEQGGASLRNHPRQPGTVKYLYDINLCRVYVWRWNISADFDGDAKLVQAWVNGEPVHAAAPQKRAPESAAPGASAAILKLSRPRPEADKGESSLTYLMLSVHAPGGSPDDQLVMGAGPTRPGVPNMGTMHAYANVERWRSIFDPDAADRIVDYAGTCPSMDAWQRSGLAR